MNLAAHIFEQLDDANRAAAHYLAIGREQGQREGKTARDALRAVVASYDQALAERPDFPFPTTIVCAVEACRKVIA